MYQKAEGAGRGQRLVSRAPVRDRRQRHDPREHDGARDPRGFRRRAARLLGHRLRHRRHGHGRRPRAAQGAPGNEDHPQRAGQSRSSWAAAAPRNAAPTARRPRATPAFEPHPIQGWTPDFIPYVLQEAIDKHYYDELIPIAGPVGIEWSRKLAQQEGIFTGISGGATFAARDAGRRERADRAR